MLQAIVLNNRLMKDVAYLVVGPYKTNMKCNSHQNHNCKINSNKKSFRMSGNIRDSL